MKALTWQGTHDVEVKEVADPVIEQDTDAVIRITSTAICGSDLHLYEVLGPFLEAGDVLGHEPMGIVEEVGSDVKQIAPGDRVVIPFNIACGSCWMCSQHLYAQCETTQNRDTGTGASLFGYTKLYGEVPGGQAEFLRVPQAQFGPIKVPEGPPDSPGIEPVNTVMGAPDAAVTIVPTSQSPRTCFTKPVFSSRVGSASTRLALNTCLRWVRASPRSRPGWSRSRVVTLALRLPSLLSRGSFAIVRENV